MKEIIDIFIIVVFVFILAVLIIGFNKQTIEKHKKLVDEKENNKNKEDIND